MMKTLDTKASSIETPGRFPFVERGVSQRVSLLAVAACFALTVGCAKSDDRLTVHPVKGKITVAGKIPEGALIVLYPDAGGEEALRPSGKVRNDGSFALTTYEADDGAPAGDYVATVAWNKLVKKGESYSAGPNVIPKSYSDRPTSVWKVKVSAGPNELNPLDIPSSK